MVGIPEPYSYSRIDGGHVLFTLYEMIVGKPVPQKVLENAQMIGVIFLLGLMLLIFGSDIFKRLQEIIIF
jgi:regulator of sigma E protease